MTGQEDPLLAVAIAEAILCGALVVEQADQLGALWLDGGQAVQLTVRRGLEWDRRLDCQAALYRPWADLPPGRSIQGLMAP